MQHEPRKIQSSFGEDRGDVAQMYREERRICIVRGSYPELAVEIVTSKKEAADPASRRAGHGLAVQLDSLGMPPRARDLRQSLARAV